jgi:ubiquinone/menaquinone biosynthesis C-methylase UbiE
MIPIHLIHSTRQMTQAKKWLTGKLAKPGETSKPCGLAGHGPQATTVGRLILAVVASLAIAGAVVGTYWGGVGFLHEEPETSVRPGINTEWADTNVAPLVARLESDEREIYRARARIAALIGLKDGDDIADVGAGSGFMSEEFSRLVGNRGSVTAVEINAGFVDYIAYRAEHKGLVNVKPRLGLKTKLNIARRENGNFNYVFLADTYHHLEYPKSMLQSIRRLLRNRGQLILVDVQRIPGQSNPEILEHVRLSEDDVIREVSAAGFRLQEKRLAPFLTENYFLCFVKD